MTPSQYVQRNRERIIAKQQASDAAYANREKKKAEAKAQELNGYAGYSRFSVRETIRNDVYAIYDSLTGVSYNYGTIASTPALLKLTNDLKKEAKDKQIDAVSSASAKAKRRTALRHFDFDEKPSLEDIEHYGVLGMKWGVRRYQPYPDGKSGTYLGEKPKYTKEENTRRKDLIRGVTAAQKNLKDKRLLAKTPEDNLTRARKENEAAHKMVVLPWNRDKKRELITETERYVEEAMKDLEIPRANVARAKNYVDKQIAQLEAFAEEMNAKYGSENISQIKKYDNYTLYDEGKTYVDSYVKVGINMANFPVIGNYVAANYIVDWETAEREALSEQRSEIRRKNSY